MSEAAHEGSELLRLRHDKLQALRQRGIDPFGGRYPVTHWAGPLHARLETATEEELKAVGPVRAAGLPLAEVLPRHDEAVGLGVDAWVAIGGRGRADDERAFGNMDRYDRAADARSPEFV